MNPSEGMISVNDKDHQKLVASHMAVDFAFEDALAELAAIHGDRWVDRFINKRIRRNRQITDAINANNLSPEADQIRAEVSQTWATFAEDALRDALNRARTDPNPSPYEPSDEPSP